MEHGQEYNRKVMKLSKMKKIINKMKDACVDANVRAQEFKHPEEIREAIALEEEIQFIQNEIDELEHELKFLFRDDLRKFYFEQEGLQP